MNKTPLLKKRYHVINQIGEGGMGKTYLSTDTKTDRSVVIKMLHIRKLDDWKTLELFDREARTLKNIDHPFIPDYIDFFSNKSENDPSYYLVQEYIKGDNLEKIVSQGKRFTDEQVTVIAKNVLSILSYLHGLRPPVIHRDINPRNIILSKINKLYLVDFGAVSDAIRSSEYGGSTVVGTFGFMPPEQMMGSAVPSSDLYSLAATLVFLLSHKMPGSIPVKHMKLDYKPYVKTSAALFRFIDACLEPDVSHRVANAQDALAILENHNLPSMSKMPRETADTKETKSLALPFGSLIKVTNMDVDCVSITLPRNPGKSLAFFGLSTIWFIFIFAWTAFALSFAGLFSLFSVPFWIAGVFLVAKGIGGMKNETIKLTPGNIELRKSILGGKMILPLERITRVANGSRLPRL
ncbi:MAG: serine/threonine protein kinase, partial [Spirochaetaceae bacterium]